MTVLDAACDLAQVDPATERFPEVVTITDTTELRWFAEGQLPASVASWFTHDRTRGFVEERTDTYRLDGRLDTGVKRRFGEKLELKVRRSIGDRLALGLGLAGRLEVWRRWSPAECLVIGTRNVPWADVHKTVVKRRFSIHGDEVELSADNRAVTGAGCDVEIAAVTVDDIEAWTFAFAAFGVVEGRRDALVAAMRTIVGGVACPNSSARSSGARPATPSGSPSWHRGVAVCPRAISVEAERPTDRRAPGLVSAFAGITAVGRVADRSCVGRVWWVVRLLDHEHRTTVGVLRGRAAEGCGPRSTLQRPQPRPA